MDESDVSLEEELDEYCESDSLSEDGLREIFERHELIPNTNNNLHVDDHYEFFIWACFNQRVTEEIIRLLLEYFPDAARPNGHYCPAASPLHVACGNQNMTLNIIKLLIDEDPVSVRSVDVEGTTPLHALCDNDQVDNRTAMQILKLLIEKYPEAVRHADNKGDLPIHIAAMSKSPEFCRVLTEAYPESRRIANDFGSLPLHYASKGASVATVEYLYKLYPDAINNATNEGSYPIHYAIFSVDRSDKPIIAIDIVKFLLDCDPDVKLQTFGEEELSLLHVACQQRCNDSNMEAVSAALEIIQVIYDEYPESICMECSLGQLPLHYCCRADQCERGSLQILQLLLEKYPEGVRRTDRHGRLPIHHAAFTKSAQFCRVLIEAYPGSEQISSLSGDLPLHFACYKNTLDTVEYFHKLYPDAINQTATEGYDPICFAIAGMTHRRNPAVGVEIVQFMLDCDPNVATQEYEGSSLLHFACRLPCNLIKACMEVIEAIYDAYPVAIDGMVASQVQHFCEDVQAFINNEFVYLRQVRDNRLVTIPDENGQLALHRALQNNVRLGSIKLLVLGNLLALLSPDNSGALPLHVACKHHDSTDVIRYLVGDTYTSTLEAVDTDGNSALHYVCCGARYEIIAMWLEKFDAVSVSKRNADEKLPIDLLWESDLVSDRESVEYTESVYRLLRAYPDMIMGIDVQVQSASASSPTPSLTGKKRSLGH